MARRKRRKAPKDEFRDPLGNYEPQEYSDSLERSLCEDLIHQVMETKPFFSVSADASIEQAMKSMSEKSVACAIVLEGDRMVGIFSERDVLNKVAGQFEQIKSMPVRIVMTHELLSVYETDSPAKALNMMAIGGFRHVPILDLDEKVTGIVGPRRVIRYIQPRIVG